MSNLTTYYTVGGVDLSIIFAPKSSGSNPTTGFTTGGLDLSNIFQPWDGTSNQANPTGYTFLYNGSKADLSDTFQIFPKPFSTSATVQLVSGYYIITFLNTNSPGGPETTIPITFNTTISNASIICVGSGGGGGSGGPATGGGVYSGRGGGGGGNIQITNQTLNVGTYVITVSTGGLGGDGTIQFSPGTDGGHSSINNISGITILECSGGGGGDAGDFGTGGGIAGTVLSGGSGGSGGNGGDNNNSGQNSDSYSNQFTIPDALSQYIESQYGGGGGGSDSTSPGGESGSNGKGGMVSGYSEIYGQNASSYGSGGGGAGNLGQLSPVPGGYNGGNGANGTVIIYFPYP